MSPCKNSDHKNAKNSAVYENCGSLRYDDIGDSGDNQDSEYLSFDDEYLVETDYEDVA